MEWIKKAKAWIVTKWWQYWAWDKKMEKKADEWADKHWD